MIIEIFRGTSSKASRLAAALRQAKIQVTTMIDADCDNHLVVVHGKDIQKAIWVRDKLQID